MGIGGTLQGFFSRAGVTAIPGSLIGGDIASGVNNTWNGSGWQGQNYTQIGLHTPGGYERITYNDTSRTAEQAADLLIAEMFKANILRGGVSGVSNNLKTATAFNNPMTAKAVSDLLDFVEAYEKLGKSANTAKEALIGIGKQFGEMSAKAGGYGLDPQPIVDEFHKSQKRYAQDFIDNMLDPLAVQLRALKDEKDNALASAEYIRDNVSDVYVDINKVTEFYLKKELDLKTQYAQQALGNLQDLITRLTFGDLANASPTTQFAGQKASYLATLAQARAGSSDATGRLAGVAEAYATAGRSYFGSSSEYAAIADQIRRDLLERQAAALGTDSGSAAQLNALMQVVQQQAQSAAANDGKLEALTEQLQALVAQLARR